MTERAGRARLTTAALPWNQLSFGVLVLAAGWIYWPGIKAVIRSWDFDYDHGPVLLLIALYLFYERRQRIAAVNRGPAWIGLAGLLLAGLAWSLAYLASIQSVEMLLMPVIVAGLFLLTMGWRSLLAASLPISYLYFAMPVWGFLNPLLQALTVAATSQIMALVRIPAQISGNFVILPNGVFEIASGCSGLSYFISAGAIGILYAGLYLRGLGRRSLMVMSALALAVLANWIRVVLIIVAGYQTDMQHYLVAVDHYWFGWAIFGIFLVPIFWLGRRLEHGPEAKEEASAQRDPAIEAPPLHNRLAGAGLLVATGLAAMSAAPLAAGALGGEARSEPQFDRAALRKLALPAEIEGFRSASVLSGEWWPAFQNVQFGDSKSYLHDGIEIETHWLVYPEQRQGAEAINAYNFFAERGVWRQQETWQETLQSADGLTIPVTEALITSTDGGRKRLSVAYYVAGELAGPGIDAKLSQVRGILRGRRDAAVLLLGVDCEKDCPDAVALQQELLIKLIAGLTARLDGVIEQLNSQPEAGSSP